MITPGSHIFSASKSEGSEPGHLGYVISTARDGNMGLHIGFPVEAAIYHRQILLQRYGLALERLVAMEQVHGAGIVQVDENDTGKGAFSMLNVIAKADALITSSRKVVLLAQGADCPLCCVYDPVHEAVGVAHSGWRGILAGIIPGMVKRMAQAYGTNPKSVRVKVSPCAGSCCYEVGEDMKDFFTDTKLFEVSRRGIRSLNIKKAVKDQLLNTGIAENHIEISDICTICDERFFSYRRQKQNAGRFGLFAWLH